MSERKAIDHVLFLTSELLNGIHYTIMYGARRLTDNITVWNHSFCQSERLVTRAFSYFRTILFITQLCMRARNLTDTIIVSQLVRARTKIGVYLGFFLPVTDTFLKLPGLQRKREI